MGKGLLFSAMLCGLVLSACNSGESILSSNSDGDTADNIVKLLPLNVSMHDVDDKPISYIDVTKSNSHYEYKLTFSNPNPVTVSVPQPIDYNVGAVNCDLNWAYGNNESKMPGLCNVTGVYQKTTNIDDCYNMSSINPGAECSFYTVAYNDLNATTQTSFSYPVSYYITQTETESPESKSNKLYVQQCTTYYDVESGQSVIKYNCSNEKKPGFANQFVTYHLNSTTAIAPNIAAASIDGKWSY